MKKRRSDKNFNLQEYLERFKYFDPDYNPEYIPKEEREIRYCKNKFFEI